MDGRMSYTYLFEIYYNSLISLEANRITTFGNSLSALGQERHLTTDKLIFLSPTSVRVKIFMKLH